MCIARDAPGKHAFWIVISVAGEQKPGEVRSIGANGSTGEGDVIIYEELEDRKGSDNGRREASTTHWNPEYSSNGHRRHPMKGGTSIVYHARFQAEVSAKVKLFGRARGTRFMDRNRRLLSSGQVSARFDLRASLSSAS